MNINYMQIDISYLAYCNGDLKTFGYKFSFLCETYYFKYYKICNFINVFSPFCFGSETSSRKVRNNVELSVALGVVENVAKTEGLTTDKLAVLLDVALTGKFGK